MDSLYYEYLQTRLIEEFPRLVQVVGYVAALTELDVAMQQNIDSSMLYPEETQEIRAVVLAHYNQ